MIDKSDLNWPIRSTVENVLPVLDSNMSKYANMDLWAMRAFHPLNLTSSLEFVSYKMQQLTIWLQNCNELITDSLFDAWNMVDDFEKEAEVNRLAERINEFSNTLIEWEKSVASIIPHTEASELFGELQGTTKSLQKDLHTVFKDISFVLEHEELTGEMVIKKPFRTPKSLFKINRILEKYAHEVKVNSSQRIAS